MPGASGLSRLQTRFVEGRKGAFCLVQVVSALRKNLSRKNSRGNFAFLACERRKRLTEADGVRFLAVLEALNITTDHQTEQHAGGRTLGLARQHGLSVYDAAYLELAMRLGLPLASKDETLRNVARAVGLSVLPAEIQP